MSFVMEESDWRVLRAMSRVRPIPPERDRRIVELVLDKGMARSEVAWGLRMSLPRISSILKASGRHLTTTRKARSEAARARRAEALAMRENFMTFREIGDKLGVSQERARQIVLAARRRLEST